MREPLSVTNIKELLKETGKRYGERPAYKFKTETPGVFNTISHKEIRAMVDNLGTALVDLLNLNAVIGEFEKGKPKKATILSKDGNDYYCYHGTFTSNGAKAGNKFFYYSATQEKLLFGEFAVNKFEGGFCALFNDDGEIMEISKLEKGKVYKENEINENEVKSKKEIMTNFRNIILGKDYFEQLIHCFQVVLNFRDKYMIDMDILNSEKYIDIMSISLSYLKVGIYKDIEKYLKY